LLVIQFIPMIGVDLSLSPIVWAAPRRHGIVHGTLDRADPSAIAAAVRAAGIGDKSVALAVPAVPPRDVWIGTLPKALAGARARRAAILAASQQLKADPSSIVVSLDRAPDGTAYVAIPREAVTRWTAPWQAARWQVKVVEPAAVALLRAAGGDAIELFVRTGTSGLELVVGSRIRWVLARMVELDWTADPGHARVEIGDTLDLARKAGAEPIGLAIGGVGPAGLLMDAIAGLAPTRPLIWKQPIDAAEIPPAAVVAASAALWASPPRVSGPTERGRFAAGLSRLLRRRSTDAT